MDEHLESVQWGEFRVNEIFEIVNSKPYHKTQLKINDGKIPYITRTSLNNGLECMVKDNGFNPNPRDTISFSAENADFFYQGVEYITGNKMYFLKSKNINRYTGLFLVQVLQSSIKGCGFGYGKRLTGTRLKGRTLFLPLDSQGKPNWAFMESYMRFIEKRKLQTILEYFNSRFIQKKGGHSLAFRSYNNAFSLRMAS